MTITISSDNGFSQVLTGSSTSVNQVLSNLAAGTYTITADYNRTAGWWIAETLTLNVTTVNLTHLDEFVATTPVAETGNVLADDVTVSSFVKFLIDDGTGTFVRVANGTVVDGEFGQLTINADGTYSYVPNQDLNVIGQADTFTYRLEHPNGTVSEATLTINLAHGDGPYDPPVSGFMMGGDDIVGFRSFGGELDDEFNASNEDGDFSGLLDDSGEIELPPADDESPSGGESDDGSSDGSVPPANDPPIEDPFDYLEQPKDDDLPPGSII